MRNTEGLLDSLVRPSGVLPQPFACSWTSHGDDVVWVRLAGELDVATAPQLKRTLESAQSAARTVVVDLRQIASADSSTLHTLIEADTRARRGGRRLAILRGPPHVDRIFTLTRASDALEIIDSEAAASRPPASSRRTVSFGDPGRGASGASQAIA